MAKRNAVKASATIVARSDTGPESVTPQRKRVPVHRLHRHQALVPSLKINQSALNITIIHDFEGDWFWMAKENAHFAPIIIAEPDPLLGTPDDVGVVPQWQGAEILPADEWIEAVITQMDRTEDDHI